MAQDEVIKILKIDTGDSQQTVKGLREEIKDLRDGILNLEKGTDDYTKAVDKLQKDQRKLDEVMSLTKKTATALDGSYDSLVQKMSLLKKEWRATNDESKRNELGKQIATINEELKSMDEEIGNFQRNVGNYTNSIVDAFDQLNVEIGEWQNKAAAAWQTGDMEAYGQAIEEIGRKQGVIDQITKDSEFLNGSTEKRMQAMVGVAEGLAGGFAAVQGIMALAGNESEEFEKVMVKLSAAMAVIQGLQGIQGFIGGLKGMKYALEGVIGSIRTTTAALSASGWGAAIVAAGAALAALITILKNAKSEVDALGDAFARAAQKQEMLSKYMSRGEKALEREIKLMTARGASEEDIINKRIEFYKEEKKKQEKLSTDNYRQLTSLKDRKAAGAVNSSGDKIKDEDIDEARKLYEESVKQLEILEDILADLYNELEVLNIEASKASSTTTSKVSSTVSSKLSDDIDVPDEEIDIEDDFTPLETSNDASTKATVKIMSEERKMRKRMSWIILMDEEDRRKLELKAMDEFNQKKLEILKQAALEEVDPVKKGDLLAQVADQEIEIERAKNEELARMRKESNDNFKTYVEGNIEITRVSLDTLGTILTSMNDIYASNAEAELKAGKITEKEYEKIMKVVKQMQIASAIINTIQGALGAYMQSSAAIPPPFGQIVGGIQAAAITATGMAQVQKIKNTDVSGKGGVASLGGGYGSVQPDTGLMEKDYEGNVVRNLTGFKEIEELNKAQKVYILESDLQESAKRVQVREDETTF